MLGCLVSDSATGDALGRVKSIVFDRSKEGLLKLVIDQSQAPPPTDTGQRLVGRMVFDAAHRYLGEIVDVVAGAHGGGALGLVVERQAGQPEFLPLSAGLLWGGEHWIWLSEVRPDVQVEPPPFAQDDWMVGHLAATRLTDPHGQVIVEPGQRITISIIEQASKAGVLHQLEASS